MKKILSILGLVAVIGIGSFAVASASDGIVENRYDSMRDYHKEDLDRALENGEVSKEEAEKWDEHYEYMDEFHNENKFRGCHGRGRGRGRGMGRGHRY